MRFDYFLLLLLIFQNLLTASHSNPEIPEWDSPFDTLLQNFHKVQKLLEHMRLFGTTEDFDLETELDLAIENSPNSFEILEIMTEAHDYCLEMDFAFLGELLAEAFSKIRYYQENLDSIKSEQIETFMAEKNVSFLGIYNQNIFLCQFFLK